MTRKRATSKRARPTPAQTPSGETALFLETCAQFHRLTGPEVFQKTIEELISSSEKVGTSAHVKREFDYVYGGFFRTVIFNVGRLSDPLVERRFSAMWTNVHQLMPKHFRGGPSVFLSIGLTLSEMFGTEPIAPTMLLNVLGGLKGTLLGGFYWGEYFSDESVCGVWKESPNCDCGPVPGPGCKLKELCIASRANFIASIKTLARAGREESKWLKKNLPLLEKARGKALMQILGDHPGHVGDPVIFWEAPDGSTVLTRDLTFRILQRAHREQIKVHILRLPRKAGSGECKILPESSTEEINGILLDYNAQGARIRAPQGSVRTRQRVTVTAPDFRNNGVGDDRREGRVLYFDKKDRAVFAVRFPSP